MAAQLCEYTGNHFNFANFIVYEISQKSGFRKRQPERGDSELSGGATPHTGPGSAHNPSPGAQSPVFQCPFSRCPVLPGPREMCAQRVGQDGPWGPGVLKSPLGRQGRPLSMTTLCLEPQKSKGMSPWPSGDQEPWTQKRPLLTCGSLLLATTSLRKNRRSSCA